MITGSTILVQANGAYNCFSSETDGYIGLFLASPATGDGQDRDEEKAAIQVRGNYHVFVVEAVLRSSGKPSLTINLKTRLDSKNNPFFIVNMWRDSNNEATHIHSGGITVIEINP